MYWVPPITISRMPVAPLSGPSKIGSAFAANGDIRTATTAKYLLFVRFIGLPPKKKNFLFLNMSVFKQMEQT